MVILVTFGQHKVVQWRTLYVPPYSTLTGPNAAIVERGLTDIVYYIKELFKFKADIDYISNVKHRVQNLNNVTQGSFQSVLFVHDSLEIVTSELTDIADLLDTIVKSLGLIGKLKWLPFRIIKRINDKFIKPVQKFFDQASRKAEKQVMLFEQNHHILRNYASFQDYMVLLSLANEVINRPLRSCDVTIKFLSATFGFGYSENTIFGEQPSMAEEAIKWVGLLSSYMIKHNENGSIKVAKKIYDPVRIPVHTEEYYMFELATPIDLATLQEIDSSANYLTTEETNFETLRMVTTEIDTKLKKSYNARFIKLTIKDFENKHFNAVAIQADVYVNDILQNTPNTSRVHTPITSYNMTADSHLSNDEGNFWRITNYNTGDISNSWMMLDLGSIQNVTGIKIKTVTYHGLKEVEFRYYFVLFDII